MENLNEVQVMEDVAEASVHTGLTNGQKVGIIVGASVLTAGLGYGIYRLVKFIKAKRTAKANSETSEQHE